MLVGPGVTPLVASSVAVTFEAFKFPTFCKPNATVTCSSGSIALLVGLFPSATRVVPLRTTAAASTWLKL